MTSSEWSKLKKEACFKIEKQAFINLPLKPHQRRVVNRISRPDQPGLVVAHGLGSGKTLSSIAALQKLNMPTNVIVPASLQGNYQKEIGKWLGGMPKNTNIYSQQGLARKGTEGLAQGLDIIDESHKARSPDSMLLQALRTHPAKKRLLLTATPTYNHPRDLSPLVNMAAGKRLLPENKTEFEDRYVGYNRVQPNLIHRLMGVREGLVPELKNVRELKSILGKYVDYHPNSTEGFPSSSEQVVNVPMAKGQDEIYRTIMGKAPWWLKYKVRAGLPPGKGEFEAMRAFLTGARQVSNTSRGFVKNRSDEQSAKIDKAFKYFSGQLAKDPNYKGIVYSNYLESGLAPYKQRLQKAGIPFGEFSGDIDPKVRNQLVKDYNNNKIRALLLSSAGSEGLDLKGTAGVQLLDPSWNLAKEKQIIGRAIRYGSHSHLPKNKQHVQIQRYIAQPHGNWLDRLLGKTTVKGVDEYISNIAQQKEQLNNQFINLMASQNQK